jgi:hypothetical protein
MHGGVGVVSAGQVSLLDALLGLIDFLLGDIGIAVVGPDGVGSQLGTFAVRPVTQRNISNSLALVVLGNLHNFSILDVALSFQLQLQSLVFLHFIEGPRGADGENVLSFVLALVLVLVIGKETSLIGINCASAVLGVVFETESRLDVDDVGAFRLFVSGIGEGIVVCGEDVILGDP